MWSTYVKIISAFTVALTVGTIVFITMLVWDELAAGHSFMSVEVLVTISIILILTGVLGWILLYFPRKITVRDGNFIVRRFAEDKVIDSRKVKYIRRLTNSDLDNVVLCGSGGAGGYFGFFRSRTYGKVYLYAQNLKYLLFMEMSNGKNYMISYDPRDPAFDRIFRQLSQSITGNWEVVRRMSR